MGISLYMKTLGIIGGMGPQASIQFLELVMNRCTESFHVTENDEYPRVLLSSLPVPYAIEHMDKKMKAQNMIIQEAVRLQCSGADFLVMTCNTMHILSEGFVNVISIPFLSIIDTVVHEVVMRRFSTVGLLGSEATMSSGLYRDPLIAAGVNVVIPTNVEKLEITDAILATISGNHSEEQTKIVLRVIRSLADKGADAVILGCTELPLLVHQSMTDIPVLDSLALLADVSCKEIFS